MLRKLLALRVRSGDAGSATIEVAILTPVLMLFVLGAADFARVFREQIIVSGAAQAGAHYGSRSKLKSADVDGMIQAAERDASDLGEVDVTARRFCQCPGAAGVSCARTCGGGVASEIYVEVTVEREFNTAVRYPGIPHTIELRRTATMRVE